jgi:hypothetical protein
VKLKVCMKDPDTLHDAVEGAVRDEVAKIPGLDDEEREAVAEARSESVRKLCGTWFGYGEYLTVEVDTEAKTCTVLKDKG